MSMLRQCTFAVTLLALAQGLAAQTTARLRGEVTDPEGSPLPGATVTVQSEALLGGSRSAVTGDGGSYSFNALPPGAYNVEAALEGYQTQRAEGVHASINTTTTVSFELPAAFTAEVTVLSEVPIVDLTSSSVGSSFGSELIEDLPLQRYFWDTMILAPGVSSVFEDNSGALVAFGAGASNHAWKIDGMDADAPFLGAAWWFVNPDTIEEVQVLGVGAPAEFGNMLGAAFNVVTKSGGNDLEGSVNLFWQDDSLTDSNVTLEGEEFPEFTREKFVDATATLGGPIKRDKAWFFLAGQHNRDAATEPGINPDFAPQNKSDKYDLKLNLRPDDQSTLDVKLHYEDWVEAEAGSLTTAPSTRVNFEGTNPGWALSYGRVLTDRTFLELKAGAWEGDLVSRSQTGSTEPALVDVSPPQGGSLFVSGGPLFPFDFDNQRQQGEAVVSHYAEDLLAGDHDFKFGVSYSAGESVTTGAPGPEGSYYLTFVYAGERYYYRYTQQPYTYGSETESFSAYADDSWQVSDKLTLNVGVRWDRHRGKIPDYDRLGFDFEPTGEKIPGVDPAFDSNKVSPRFGFAYNPDSRTVVRGAFGVYYDDVVTGNWDFPPPDLPPQQVFFLDPGSGEWILVDENLSAAVELDPDLHSPRTFQYTLGFERQLRADMSFGAQAIYKTTDDLVGWEILGDGVYVDVPWTNPFTGEEVTLLGVVEEPTVRKGNRAGFTILGPDTEYEQTYKGLILTFNKRLSRGWSLNASYTWSKSEGLIPQQFSNFQNNILLRTTLGTDPNQFLNADTLLQGDREHMLRVQAVFRLPWDLLATAVVNLQSGRPYQRQFDIRGILPQGTTRVIAVPNAAERYDFQEVIDFAIGKRFEVGPATLKLDAQLFNLLNDDAVDRWATLRVLPGQDYVARTYLQPRRLMLRLGVTF